MFGKTTKKMLENNVRIKNVLNEFETQRQELIKCLVEANDPELVTSILNTWEEFCDQTTYSLEDLTKTQRRLTAQLTVVDKIANLFK